MSKNKFHFSAKSVKLDHRKGENGMLLLFVEDEFYTREGIMASLDWNSLGIDKVETAADGKSGEEALALRPDILLTDIRMPYKSGLELAALAKQADPDCEVIILSSYSDKEYLFQAISLSTVAYIEKPVDLSELTAAVEQAAQRRRQKLRLRQLEGEERETGVLAWLPDLSDKSFSHSTCVVLRFLAKQYADPSLSVEQIAGHVHLNAAYLSDSFKKDTGRSLKRLITEVRIKKACELLAATNLSVAAVAGRVGYRNPSYFSRLFHQETGMSPLEYREAPAK